MLKNFEADILIVGAGPAGLTAAIYGARSGKKTLVLEGRSPSRLALGYEIENYPGFLSVDSAELLAKFRAHALHFGAEIVSGDAVAFGLDSDPKFVTTKDAFIQAKAVILATGKPLSKERMIPGEDRLTGSGVSYCATCDGPLFRGAEVAVFGHSEEAIEDVLALGEMGCRVHWIPGGRGEERARAHAEEFGGKGIRIHFGAVIREISGEKRVEKVVLEKGEGVEDLPVAAVFIFRETPTAPFFSRAGITLDRGTCIAVDRFQKTNLPGVFAAGDVTCGGLQIASAVGEGCVAAMQALIHLRR
ncbi:MAG: NAD(P)/FAD-dependent oxidoreductase [Candidatus Aminicenantales bacterium]